MINVISDRSGTDASPSVDSHVIGKAASRNSHKAWCMGGLLTLLTISMPATTQTLKPVEPPGTNLPAAAEVRVPDDATASLIVMQRKLVKCEQQIQAQEKRVGVISDTQRHCAKQRQALQAQLSVDAQKSLDQVAAAKAADDKLRTSTYARQLRDEDQRAEEVQAYMRSQEYRTITNFHNLSRCQRQRWAAKQKKESEKGENGSDTKTGVPISENPPVSCVEELQLSEADLAQISAYLKQLAK